MTQNFRIATFNCENLFARYKFEKAPPPTKDDGFTVNDIAFEGFSDAEKRITGEAIHEVGADVIALQEVESLGVLDHFVSTYLPHDGYDHRVLIDSHDPRQIDVAVLSKHPIERIKTHRQERTASGKEYVFSRDCLEVEVHPKSAPDKAIALYAQHFKSMLGGRAETRERRVVQAERVADIVDARWQPHAYKGNFVVLGDLNDYLDPLTSLTPLVQHKGLSGNIVERRPQDDRWTHFEAKDHSYLQLDYVLLSKDLDHRAGKPTPQIMRKGVAGAATKYAGPRFAGVGKTTPVASDHCPVYVDVPTSAL